MQEEAVRQRRFSLGAVVGLAVFLVALAIRLVGVGWGLKNDLHNQSYHPDETDIFLYSRQIVPGRGEFVPHFYNYGTLYLTLLRISSDVATTYLGGPKEGGEGFSRMNPGGTDWDWVARCQRVGRILSCFAGAGTALVASLMTRRFYGLAAGALAGTLIAIAPAHVVHSRFQTVDVMATFFLACSLYWAIKIAEPLKEKSDEVTPMAFVWKEALWCGVFAGLSAGTKYLGILALLSLFAALALRRPKDSVKSAAVGIAAALVTFVLSTPGSVVDTARFVADTQFELQHSASGHGLLFVHTASGYLFSLINLTLGIGPILVLMGIGGLAWAAYRRRSWAIVMLAFFLPYYFIIGRSEVKFVRYTFPLYIPIAAGFGYAMVAGHRRGGFGRGVVVLGILGLGGMPYGGLLGTKNLTEAMVNEDPRDAAARYLRQTGGAVGLAKDPWYWTPPLFADVAEPRSVPWEVRMAQMASANPSILYLANPDGPKVEWDSRLVNEVQPPHIEISSFEVDPVRRLRGVKQLDPAVQGEIDADSRFLDGLDKNYDPEATFGSRIPLPEDLEYVDPTVYVWKKKSSR